MTTEEIIRIINNSYIMTISEFINRSSKLFTDITTPTIIHKQDMGISGSLVSARFYHGKDEILVKGFHYLPNNWSEETHGYIIAKQI